jgi:hypothetical protein
LYAGFPEESEQHWDQGFERIEQAASLAKDQIALALEVDGQYEGIILTLCSQPDWAPPDYELVNLSSWYVSDNARAHATWMLRKITRRPNSIFVDLSPTDGVARLSALMKFVPLNDGVVRIWLAQNIFASRSDGARLISCEQMLDSLSSPQRRTNIETHLSNDLVGFGLRVQGKVYPLLFRKNQVRGLPLGLTLYFCSDVDVFMRNIGVIARGMLRRGCVTIQVDRIASLPPTLKYSLWSNRVRIATAGFPPNTIDYLNTESELFGFD